MVKYVLIHNVTVFQSSCPNCNVSSLLGQFETGNTSLYNFSEEVEVLLMLYVYIDV